MSFLEDKEFVFIVGSPRSGTTWLQILLGAHPLVATTVELNIFHNYTAPWILAWERTQARRAETDMQQGLSCLWGEQEFYSFIEDFVVRTYRKVAALNPRASHILDKSCEYAFHADHIKSLIPNARFVHIVRDGRDVCASMMAARQTIGDWGSTIERASGLWLNHVSTSLTLRRFTDSYHELRYEDLLNDPTSTLTGVLDFCGLHLEMDQVRDICNAHNFSAMRATRQESDRRFKRPADHYRKGIAGAWKSDLTAQQKAIFNQVAGNLLIDLGYENEPGWESH